MDLKHSVTKVLVQVSPAVVMDYGPHEGFITAWTAVASARIDTMRNGDAATISGMSKHTNAVDACERACAHLANPARIACPKTKRPKVLVEVNTGSPGDLQMASLLAGELSRRLDKREWKLPVSHEQDDQRG